jgi:putative phosphoribosyl transferase
VVSQSEARRFAMARFANRRDAGRQLAARLDHLEGPLVVLGMARGGVPVATEVARALAAPLDVLVVRKLGVPFQPELAMGALGEGGVVVVDESIVGAARVSAEEFAAVRREEEAQLRHRIELYRPGRSLTSLEGKTAVVVDDGIATGASARAGCRVARAHGAERVVLATPVIAPQSIAALEGEVDQLVWVQAPSPFAGVGEWYQDFSQTSDEEVVACLANSPSSEDRFELTEPTHRSPECSGEISIILEDATLSGTLTLPDGASGVVIFVHGSGSSRKSPRNMAVAASLNQRGLGTLLFDLLTEAEEGDRTKVFDIDLLARRLLGATAWVLDVLGSRSIKIGYFGASTGAGAALVAASSPTSTVSAVVSRGGRVDLAGSHLPAVRAATLLIVGSEDDVVLDLNRRARAELRCTNRLEAVEGATHLFEEPGALGQVSALAGEWFVTYLSPQVDER